MLYSQSHLRRQNRRTKLLPHSLRLALATGACVLFWRMSEGSGSNVYDLSGNGRHGTLTGTNTRAQGRLTNAENVLSTSLASTGGSCDLNSYDSGTNCTTGVTIMAWVRPTSVKNQWSIIKPFTSTHSSPYADYGMFFQSDGALGFRVGNNVANTATSVYAANTTYHFAATANGTIMQTYLNGVPMSMSQVAGSASGLPTNTNSRPIRIGRNPDGGEFFEGTIQDAGVFNRALTDTEIKGIYYAGYAPLSIGL